MNPRIEDLGVPVRSVNWVRAHVGRTAAGSERVWATMGQQAEGFFILDVDPVSEACRQIPCAEPKANYPTATCVSRSVVLYVGAAYQGHLYAYDGDLLEDLGAINPEQATFPCRIDEDAEGRLWIGSYGGADLTCYDPSTRTFERYGQMDDVDMYCYPMVDHESGLIACLIKVTQQHVTLFDPRTGERTDVGPSLTKEEGVVDLVRDPDGRLVITTGDASFAIHGTEVTQVDEVAQQDPRLSTGEEVAFADADTFLYMKLALTGESGSSRVIDLSYEPAGSEIYTLHEGPDGLIYGSSILPLHFFSSDPATGKTTDYGKASESGGEAYSMANLAGKIYVSSYPAARISVYDPARPYGYGPDPDSNPRELGRIDDVSYRPRSTLTGPQGRVWTASLPDYGLWGGPLAWLDPDSGARGSYRDVAGEGSCYTLAHLETDGLIAIGTTINAGTGTQPREEQAKLILWDYEQEAAVWEGAPRDGLLAINALVMSAEGRLYGTGLAAESAIVFAFDTDERDFTLLEGELPGRPLDHGLRPYKDAIYLVTRDGVARVDGDRVNSVIREAGAFSVPGPILDGRLYFGTNHELRRVQLTD